MHGVDLWKQINLKKPKPKKKLNPYTGPIVRGFSVQYAFLSM